MAKIQPADAQQLAAIVTDASRLRTPIVTTSGNSKWDWGSKKASIEDPAALEISLSALDGIVSYEPSELILVAGAATPLRHIEKLLGEQRQYLAFEPVHWRSTATAGGTLAVGLAGPRRFRVGGVRDFVLGLQFVDGKGRLVRSGGRVVKNVSGYDLWRGLTGSFGGLGLVTEICFKLWPRPETECTLIVDALQPDVARQTMLMLAQQQQEITGLAYLPTQGLLVRVEASVSALRSQIETIAGKVTVAGELSENESAEMWRGVREVEELRKHPGILWRFVLPAGSWVELIADLQSLGVQDYQVDWGGGLVWAVLPPEPALQGHTIARRHSGIAWRIAATPADANHAGVPPLEPGLARLNMRLKSACDPHAILNPGRGWV